MTRPRMHINRPKEVFEPQVRRKYQRFWQNASTDGQPCALLSSAILEAVRRQSGYPIKHARVLAIDTSGMYDPRVVWEAQLK
jgi:hypothetical protein